MKNQSAKSSTKQLLLGKKFLFTCILILVAITPLIILEVYVRTTRSYIDLWVETGRKSGPHPNKEWAIIDAFSAYYGRPGEYSTNKMVNSSGFISTPELAVSKPPDTIRVVFLGGSATAGTGRNLADEDTWPWQVTEILRSEFPQQKIEFINGALGGYTSFESYGRLWSRIRFFSPDIVVIYQGWNEMYYFDDVEDITSWRMLTDGDWTFDRTEKPIEPYEPLLIDYLIRPSQALTRLRLRITRPRTRNGEVGISKTLANDYDRRGLEIWRTNLRLFRETAKLLGAELFVAKQATLIVPNLPMEERTRVSYDYHGFDHNAHVDAFQRIYQIIDEEIPADRIIDVTTISGHPEYFHDHIHPTKVGASKIAEIASDVLTTYLQSHNTQLSGKQ